jgi:hypothetical protein
VGSFIYIYMYESMFYSPPLNNKKKKKKKKEKNFDVFIFANGPNLGRGGVEVYNNFVVWIQIPEELLRFFFLHFSKYLLGS